MNFIMDEIFNGRNSKLTFQKLKKKMDEITKIVKIKKKQGKMDDIPKKNGSHQNNGQNH